MTRATSWRQLGLTVVEDSSLGVVDDAAEDREAQGHQENEHVQGPR